MAINLTGLAAALATFLGVWLGHVAVRKVEASAVNLRGPRWVCIVLGLGLEGGAVLAGSAPVAAALGILGVTLLWDAFELQRQERRVRIGHAPANPANPRHARLLAQHSGATTFDWLNRNPRGRAYTPAELAQEITTGRVEL